jgi:hypothetical protein
LGNVGGYVGGLLQGGEGFFRGDFEVRVAIQSGEGLCQSLEVRDFLGPVVGRCGSHEVGLKPRERFFSEEGARVDDLRCFQCVGNWLFKELESAFGQEVEEL